MPEMTGEVPRVSVCLHHDQTGMADVLVIESCINPVPSGGEGGGLRLPTPEVFLVLFLKPGDIELILGDFS